MFRQFLLYAALFFVMQVALLMTGSRAGVTLTALSCFLLLSLQILNKGQQKTFAILSAGIFVGLGYVILGNYSGIVDERSIALAHDFDTRHALYQEIWSTVLDRPWLGYGLGSFENAFRYHRSLYFDFAGIWLRGHNVYLDCILALGIPASIALFIAAAIPLIINIIHLLKRQNLSISMTMISAWVLVMSHSYFDFGLQTGANIVTYAALVGASLSPTKASVNLVR